MVNKILIVAGKEWRDGWRNRWLLAITILFAIMAVGISWFGSVAYGQSGLAPLSTIIASLSSLAVLVMPLIALLLGYDAFVGEQEQGTLILLLTYPITKFQLVLGKFLGQASILAVASFVGFGSAAVLLSLEAFSLDLVISFFIFVTSATLLGAVFLALAHLLSLLVTEKTRAAGLALFVWFFFTLLYDLGLLSVLVGTEGWLNQTSLKIALLANPTDVFRLINLAHLEAEGTGLLASMGQLTFGYGTLFSLMILWIVGCIAASTIRFKYKSI